MIEIKPIASGSSGNSYYIYDGKTALLLDAGVSIKQIEIGCNFRLSTVAGVLITHRHNDHCKAMLDLIKRGITIYAGADVFNAKKAAGYRCKSIVDVIDSENNCFKYVYKIGTYMVYPFDVHHDVPNLGFYIHSNYTGENLLYFTDTYYIEPVFPNLNYILAEANYDTEAIRKNVKSGILPIQLEKRLFKSHMSINTLIDMLKANDLSNCKKIYLLHLSDNNSKEQDFKQLVQAETGVEVYIC